MAEKTRKKTGRPQIELDEKDFTKLCQLQCTKEEVAGWFDVSEDTIERWCKRTYGESFAVVFGKKRVGGLISLRRSQFRLAEKNAAMAIFLGKNYLGQADAAQVGITEIPDDGFLKALSESAVIDWSEDEEEPDDLPI